MSILANIICAGQNIDNLANIIWTGQNIDNMRLFQADTNGYLFYDTELDNTEAKAIYKRLKYQKNMDCGGCCENNLAFT